MKPQHIFATLALLAAVGTAHAARVLEQPERPYELSLEQIKLPSNASGGLTVKPCDACAYSTHVLSSTTAYLVDGQSVSFAEFSRIAAETGETAAGLMSVVGVFVDVETGRVNRVTLRRKRQ